MTQVNQVECKAKQVRLGREELLELIRQKLKDYNVIVRVIFELSYYSSISTLQLIGLNVSDINIKENFATVNKNGNELYIPIPQQCIKMLEQIIDTNTQGYTPLFRNNQGERLSLQEMWLIRREFWYKM